MSSTSGKPSGKPTGPRSSAGRECAAQNALPHGLLSRDQLFARGRSAEWVELLGRLFRELNPVGTLEQTLVEPIAVAFWRQKRPVRVETVRIEMSQRPNSFLCHELEDLVGENNKAVLG